MGKRKKNGKIERERLDSGISGSSQISREEKFLPTKVNMSASSVIKYLLGFFKLESPSILGTVRFRLALVMFLTLAKFDTGSSRLGFACSSEADDGLTRRCFSKYSADMSLFLHPKTFMWMTAWALFAWWNAINLYSDRHLQKIRGETGNSERKQQLCYELWKNFLLQVGFEALAISLILTFFYSTQEISLPETYKCSLRNASEEIVLTCEDMHHWDKSNLNFVFFGGMIVLTVLCIAILFHAMCNKEHFIKDLLNLNTKDKKADGNHHRNTQRNANDGSGGFTNASNHNEQRVAPGRHKRWNIDAAQVSDEICQDLADYISTDWKKLSRRLGISRAHLKNIAHENHDVCEQSIAMINKWRERAGEEATVGVLREALKEIERKDLSDKVRDKVLAKEQLPPTEEGLALWNTKTDYTDSSWQSRLETSPDLTGTMSIQTPPESSLRSNTIRHR